ncbi:MAG: hypothetical protein JWQ39_762 [Glaciihabitans sp.]|jgi:hypothetical protein|nr:hypothetical protein [Glaciihabitans sp.]
MASVEEYAQWRGISVQRVRELLRSGELPGRRVGARQWEVEETAYKARPRLGPPMSPPMAWALIALLGGEDRHPDVPPVRLDRLLRNREYVSAAGKDAPAILSSWLRHRGERLTYRADPRDLPELLADARVMPSGLSDERSGISANDVAEVWLRDFSRLYELIGDYLLLPDEKGNVVVHRGGLEHTETIAPLGLVIADLADWNGPREDSRVIDLLARVR